MPERKLSAEYLQALSAARQQIDKQLLDLFNQPVGDPVVRLKTLVTILQPVSLDALEKYESDSDTDLLDSDYFKAYRAYPWFAAYTDFLAHAEDALVIFDNEGGRNTLYDLREDVLEVMDETERQQNVEFMALEDANSQQDYADLQAKGPKMYFLHQVDYLLENYKNSLETDDVKTVDMKGDDYLGALGSIFAYL